MEVWRKKVRKRGRRIERERGDIGSMQVGVGGGDGSQTISGEM